MAVMWDAKKRVIEKLRKLPDHVKSSEKELSTLAEDLCQVENIRKMYFDSSIHCPTGIAVEAFQEDDGFELLHSFEEKKQRERDGMHIANVCDLSIKLHLVQLQRRPPLMRTFSSLLKLEYGPFHAALIVDDIVIEWDASSLVIPHGNAVKARSVFQENVTKQSTLDVMANEKVKDISSTKLDVESRFQVLWSAATAKAKVIDKLVGVIVQYNTQKEYSVFGCNCQHFVRDAMEALEIPEQPTFSGKLGDYFQKLMKQQKIQFKQFPTHEDLDRHVAANLKDMIEDEKKYLLCIYFQFHLDKLKTVDDMDGWKCPIVSCRMDKLEHDIDKGLSLFDRVVQQQHLDFTSQAKHTVHPYPTTGLQKPLCKPKCAFTPDLHSVPALRMNRTVKRLCSQPGDHVPASPLTLEEHFALLKQTESVEDQQKALGEFSPQGYKHRIMEKLRKSTQLGTSQHADDFTEVLSEHESMRAKYFSDLVEGISKPVVLRATEAQHNIEAALKNLGKVCRFSVKLVFQVGESSCGSVSEVINQPLHTLAALQVGNVFLRWNNQSLVVPSFLDLHPSFKSDLNAESQWKAFIDQKQPAISKAVERRDQARQVDVVYDLTTKKDHILYSLITVIVNYNRSKNYDVCRCNNSHFINDALKALEVRCSVNLNSTFQQYMDSLKKRKQTKIPNMFKSHRDLDTYVFESVDASRLSQADIDCLLGQYFQFHYDDWVSSGRSGAWSCKEESCQINVLEC